MGTIHAREWIATEVDAPGAALLRRQLQQERRRHQPREHARALVHAGREPGRLPVHVRRRAPLAEEPPRQRRRRPDHERRRRRPEPQLRHQLGLRRRGLLVADLERDLPRHGAASEPEVQAPPGADRPAEVQVPGHVPLVRAAAAVPVRAGRSRRRPRTTRCTSRYTGTDANPAVAGLRPRASAADLYITNGTTDDYSYSKTGALIVDARAGGGLRRLRLRLPRRRDADPGASSSTTCRSRSTSRAPHRIRPARCRISGTRSSRSTSRRRASTPRRRTTRSATSGSGLLRRSPAGAGAGQASLGAVSFGTRSTAARVVRSRRRSGTAASATARTATSTSASCRERSRGRSPGTA